MTASIWTPGSNSVPQVDPLNQIKGQQYTATAGQTDFVITQFTYNIGANALTVYVNSTKVPASELTELSTTSFRIPACDVGDIVEVVGNTVSPSFTVIARAVSEYSQIALIGASTVELSNLALLGEVHQLDVVVADPTTASPSMILQVSDASAGSLSYRIHDLEILNSSQSVSAATTSSGLSISGVGVPEQLTARFIRLSANYLYGFTVEASKGGIYHRYVGRVQLTSSLAKVSVFTSTGSIFTSGTMYAAPLCKAI